MSKHPVNANINFTKSKGDVKKWGSRSWWRRKSWGRQLTTSKNSSSSKPHFQIKKWEKPVKIGSLLWLEQVGQCIFIEYENDMIIVDAGMEFSANETLGADYIIPDIRYVKKNIKKLRGIVLSHGHLDHIWALRDMLPELWFPTIYTTPLTLGIVQKTFDNKHDVQKIKYKLVNPATDVLKLGCFTIEFVHVNHNIPETMAMSIWTPKGLIFNSSDFKIDHTPAIGEPADLAKIARIGLEWVKLYIWDSLGAGKKWWAPSEKTIGENLEALIKDTKWRMIVATFASNVGRVIQLIDSAIKYNRVVYLSGRSMINNVEICQKLWYINVPKGTIRKLGANIEQMPDERVLILCTGAQGEEFSALARMSRSEHAQVSLRPGDTILKSASVIPGNELQSQKMVNDLVVLGVNLVTNDDMDIHTSGHGGAEDHKLMLTLVKPEYFLPFYIEAYFRYEHRKLGLDKWIPDENILMPNENGTIIEMYDNGCRIGNEKLNLDTVLIDGKGKWHLSGEYVIKARQIMAHNGVVSLVFKIDSQSKELVGNVQIESRWFVYSSEVRSVHTKVVEFARSKYNQHKKSWRKETKDIMKAIKDELGEFVRKQVGREPMVVPMYVYITKNTDSTTKKPVARKTVAKKVTHDDPEDPVGMTIEEQGGE